MLIYDPKNRINGQIMKTGIEKIWNHKTLRRMILVLTAVMALISVVQGIRNAAAFSQDFQWDAVKAFTLKINPYEESLHPSGALSRYGFEKYFKQMEANQFPSLLMLLIPYTFLPPLAARYAWIISNLLFTAGIIWLLRKTFMKAVEKDVFVLLILLMLAGTPYRNQLGVGQHTLFAFFFFLLAVYFSEKENRQIPMILSLTVCYFKYTLTVPLALYFVYKRRWKELTVSVLIHVGLTEIAAHWLGTGFMDMIIEPLKVSSALVSEGGLDFGALFSGSSFSFILAGMVMLLLFVLVLFMPQKEDCLVIGILTLWALIITYHRTYDFFVLIIVAALFYEKKRSDFLKSAYAVVLLAVFFVLRLFSESA
ncbi:MAG TPA: glycosyltransferase family 87 protein, partial [Lachnospiraceae bacterium]|nr:glycosyltransferase family 87 protein [Lachnospiraceae bacterium]